MRTEKLEFFRSLMLEASGSKPTTNKNISTTKPALQSIKRFAVSA